MGWSNPRTQRIRHYCLTPDAAAHSRCFLSSTGLFGFKIISTVLNNAPEVTQHRCFHEYRHSGRLMEISYCLGTPVAEDSVTLTPDRLGARSTVVRGLTDLGMTALLWLCWYRYTLWNSAQASIARRIIAVQKSDHHDKLITLVLVSASQVVCPVAPSSHSLVSDGYDR
ncbi:hypothetical protein CSKR_107173 [Clonorchis sinensis]|uniref:Uncharacterized protein n=1 Tax=Clonorchis sinensis TaxID=79923 RepID=A0A419QD26_CLOSI|nr:hypothetical protein CSKR_107173 [Clonorchis sinensis]